MKRIIFKLITMTICALLMLTLFSGCSDDGAAAKVLESSEKLIVIQCDETGGSLEDALKALSNDGKLSYEADSSEFGAFVKSVNGYTPDPTCEYWAIYTSLGEYEGVSYSNAEFGSYDYNGKTCMSASYGISGLVMVEGEIYILTVASFDF